MKKEKGVSAAFKDPYALSIDYDQKSVVIHPRCSTLQQTERFERIELARPMDPQVLFDRLTQIGVPQPHATDLVKSVRESLSEL